VRPPKPQFAGHCQPLTPHESIGYYDLTDVETLRHQANLAKLYGVHGFCIYYYWFAGKRLLEKPLDLLLKNRDIDLPFCICWANENWTRRWDGLDQDVLIAQDHSPQDDIACIADIARYADDPRYIRIDGKPLVVVYRPQLLPDPKATAERWRQWARDQGLGELYLAYVQSFENVDPRQHGFDAAIEFPPINGNPPNITSTTLGISRDFQGAVYDWNIFIERSEHVREMKYKTFAGVNPGWDNTARKKERAHIVTGATPDRFQLWLDRAITQTITWHHNESERLVFVNAWNEWAEGAYLEPDRAFGRAFLAETARVLAGS
jgi:lipopolysaccharide biosynthesis protein